MLIIGSLSNDDGDGNENGKKAKKNNFARTSHFLYISSSPMHDYDVKLPNFTFCGGREHKTTSLFFLLNFDVVLSTPEKFANI